MIGAGSFRGWRSPLLWAAALGWAALCGWLFALGKSPSRPPELAVLLLGAEQTRSSWYLIQALLLPGLLVLQAWVLWRVMRWFCGRLSEQKLAQAPQLRGDLERLSERLASGIGAGLLFGLVFPDMIALAGWGEEGLRRVLPFSLLFSFGLSLFFTSRFTQSFLGERGLVVSWWKIILISLLGVLTQALVGAPFLR